MKVLVLGGRGFIGRHIVSALLDKNIEVVIGSRKLPINILEDKITKINPLNSKANVLEKVEIKQIRLQNLQSSHDWLTHLADVDIVVNSVGILRERRGETYNAIHNLAPTALAKACKEKNIRLIHISALGLTEAAQSRFIKSKLAGEKNLLSTGAELVIVRPSLLDGVHGFGAKWMRLVARWPIHPVMKTKGLIAPLQVADLGVAVTSLCASNRTELPEIAELGGEQAISISAYLAQLRLQHTAAKAMVVEVPVWLVRLASHVFDFLHITPLSFGHVELMKGYNVPKVNQLASLMKRAQSIG